MTWRRRRSWHDWYPPSQPREVTGGIKVRSKRGWFSESWWGRRWEEIMDSYDIGARLARGKRYARAGQVIEVESSTSGIRAAVQGSRSTPYRVRIGFAPWSEEEWLAVLDTIAADPRFVARLLGGELPEELEPALERAGIALFPAAYRELDTDCSCPDWSNPCKHIAAVAFVMARELDHDPLLLFRWRGLEREEFFDLVRAIQGEEEGAGSAPESARPLREVQEERLLAEVDRRAADRQGTVTTDDFWKPAAPTDQITIRRRPPQVVAALARRLGVVPLWRSDHDYDQIMRRFYTAIGKHGRDLVPAESSPATTGKK